MDFLMRLTRASSYALHAVVYMAVQKKDGPIPSHLIARKRGIPERFLLKVLKPLVSAQILLSVKGPNGGYRLARSANDVTLLEVIEAVDGPIRGNAPMGHDDPTNLLNRRLEQVCNQAAEHTRKQLGKIRLSELSAKD
jgi:Rrf2 family protein